jgi:hypothetical protein
MQTASPLGQDTFSDIAGLLAGPTDRRLLGEIGTPSLLTPRERNLAKGVARVVLGHAIQQPVHWQRAQDNGRAWGRRVQLIAHRAFDAGWPAAALVADAVRAIDPERPA